jgi:LuxR family transcriptional regulator, maltose regulon positive regulatory protein
MIAAPPTDRLSIGKLRIPCATAIVARPRLVERLEAGLRRPLTVVLAPAGSGKSTLLGDWARSTTRSVAWLSLDESDNDVVRFLIYLTAALSQAEAGLGDATRRLLDASYPPGPLETMAALCDEIEETPGNDLVLVLDDYHVLSCTLIRDAVEFLLDRLPSRLRLLVSGRNDPALPLARMRARNQLTEFRVADLRFSAEEAAALLADLTGEAFADSEVATLTERTEGWAAGLVLAGISLQGRTNRADLIAHLSGSHRFVLDYLVSDVLSCQIPAIEQFLLRTSILERISAPLCDALLGAEGKAQSMLDQIERANLFLYPLDEERRWYRYHHLFAEALRHQLAQREPGLIPELHRRAADWFVGEGSDADALRHYLAIPDPHCAAEIVERHAIRMLERGEVATLRTWVESLPDAEVRARPRLALCHAWALVHSNALERVEVRLQDVEEWIADHSDHPREMIASFTGEIASIRSRVAVTRGDIDQTIELSQLALSLTPANDLLTRAGIGLSLGSAYSARGDLAAADATYAEVVSYGRGAGPLMAALALRYRADLSIIQGRLGEADHLYHHAQEFIEAHNATEMPAQGIICEGLADLAYLRNNLVEAESLAEEAVRRGEAGGEVLKIAVPAWLTLARVRQARGDESGALDAINHAVCLSNWAHMRAWRARIWLRQGKLALASVWARESGRRSSDIPTYQAEIEYATLARVLLAEGRIDEAIGLLIRLQTAAAKTGRIGREIEFLAVLALAYQAKGDHDEATATLTRALELALDERQIRLFVDEGTAIGSVLTRVRGQVRRGNDSGSRRLSAYVDDLLLALSNGLPSSAEVVTPVVSSVLIEPLSEREQEVLRLIAGGSTNREIAGELYVSLGTIKAHTNHVFAKLGVRSRTEAVARARDLGLLA